MKRKTDNNGYGESLFMTNEEECFICGRGGDLARHEIIHGSRRPLSKYYGLWIYVCPDCHNEIHREDNGKYMFLKTTAQRLFEKNYPDLDFLTIFGKNYL